MAIAGLIVTPLRIIADDRGSVMHMLRTDAPHFVDFGEIYFSVVKPNVVKAWKRHREMVLNLAVPVGRMRLVVYDGRDGSDTFGRLEQVIVGKPDSYSLITIHPGLWFGFQGIAKEDTVIANCASILHRSEEAEGIDAYDQRIPFKWPCAEIAVS